MEVSSKFKYTSYLVIFFNIVFVLTTVTFAILFMSKFQFFRLEGIVFKNELFKLAFCIKIQTFINLFCTLLNNYALNIASKSMLRFTSFILINGIVGTLVFILIIVYSYTENYPNAIKNGYYLNLDIQGFINTRYSTAKTTQSKNREDFCIEEMDELVYYTLIFLYISIGALVATFVFTKLFVWIKISKPEKEAPAFENVRMRNTSRLNKLKLVVEEV